MTLASPQASTQPQGSHSTARAAQGQNARLWHGVLIVLRHLVLVLIAVVAILPFFWMIASSLKPYDEIFISPPVWIPTHPDVSNFVNAINAMPFGTYLFNTTKIATLSAIGQLLSCSLAAYAFDRLEFPGRDLIFLLLLMTLMVPYQVTFIPAFLIIQHLGLMDTHEALYLPNFLGGAFGTFLLRQFFKGIPRELTDAATIDGCTSFAVYWRIMLPIARPALATLGVFTFMWSWNDLIGPAIYLSSSEKMTLTIGLASFQGIHATRWDLLMAGSTLSVIPILVIYVLAQKYFVRGITVGGIKG